MVSTADDIVLNYFRYPVTIVVGITTVNKLNSRSYYIVSITKTISFELLEAIAFINNLPFKK